MSVTACPDMASLARELEAAGSKLVMIDFFATWCGPCKRISPSIAQWAAEFPDVVFLKVDVDENEDAAQKYDISAMPTFKFIRNKEVVGEFTGASPEGILAKIKELK